MILSVGTLSPRVKKHRYADISYLREYGSKSDINLMEGPLRVTYASFTNFGGEVFSQTKIAGASDWKGRRRNLGSFAASRPIARGNMLGRCNICRMVTHSIAIRRKIQPLFNVEQL
jgi:hypothetical protein